MDRKQLTSNNITKIILIAFILLPLITAGGMLYFYLDTFDGEFSASNGDWGTFGDFIGGVLNPIMGYLAVLGVLLTLNQKI